MTKRLKIDYERDNNTSAQTTVTKDQAVVAETTSSIEPTLAAEGDQQLESQMEDASSKSSVIVLNEETQKVMPTKESITTPSHMIQGDLVIEEAPFSRMTQQQGGQSLGLGGHRQPMPYNHVRLPGFDQIRRYRAMPRTPNNYYNNYPMAPQQHLLQSRSPGINIRPSVFTFIQPESDLVSQNHLLVHQVLHTLRSPSRTAQQQQQQQLVQMMASNPQFMTGLVRKRRPEQQTSQSDEPPPYHNHNHQQGPGGQIMIPLTLNSEQQHQPSQEAVGQQNVGMVGQQNIGMVGQQNIGIVGQPGFKQPPSVSSLQMTQFTVNQQLRQQTRRLRQVQQQLFQLRRQQTAGGGGQQIPNPTEEVGASSSSAGAPQLDNSVQMYIRIFSDLNSIIAKILDTLNLLSATTSTT